MENPLRMIAGTQERENWMLSCFALIKPTPLIVPSISQVKASKNASPCHAIAHPRIKTPPWAPIPGQTYTTPYSSVTAISKLAGPSTPTPSTTV
jgi:hypothetical protein